MLKSFLLNTLNTINNHHWMSKLVAPLRKLSSFITSWWQLLLISLASIIFLYYPLGGWMINKIDTTPDYEIVVMPAQSNTVETMSLLIKREVSEHMWTPNLPFIFPSYFLDNMPNFQMGVIAAVSNLTTAFSLKLDKTVVAGKETPLKSAASLLKYSPTIWMFSPDNALSPVPSAGSQYKKARKQLINFNQDLATGNDTFYKSPHDLGYFLKRLNTDLHAGNDALETRIRENSTDWFDLKSDNIFYYQQGKVYAYYLLFSSLARDYKDIILANDMYNTWTQMLKALENGAMIDPTLVRNAELNSSFAPNHLAYLSYYIVKAAAISQDLVYKIEIPAAQGMNK